MAFTPAKAIREKVKVKQIIAAQEILSQYQDSLSPNQREELSKIVAQNFSQAKNLAFEASLLENQGKLSEAKDLLERVKEIAVDYPGLQTDIERLEEAGHLARYVRKRSERIRVDLPKEKAKHKQSAGIIGVMLLVIIGTGFFLLSKNEKLPTAQNTEEEHISRQTPETVRPSDEKARPEETAELTESKVAVKPERPADVVEPKTTIDPKETTGVQEPKTAVMREKPSQAQPTEQVKAPGSKKEQDPEATAEQRRQQEEQKPASIVTGEQPKRTEPSPAQASQVTDNLAEEQAAAEILSTSANQFDEDFEVHVIEEGDSLSLLAYRYFCNEQERYKLFLMNSDILASPNQLVIGQRLRLSSRDIKIVNLCEPKQ